MKPCRRCGILIQLTDVQSKSRSYTCLPCAASIAREWRASNPEKLRAARRRHLEKNRDRLAAKSRQWRDLNPERKRANSKVWESENRELRLAYNRRWQAAHPDVVRVTSRAGCVVRRAINAGRLVRATVCEWCGAADRKITAAHQDYSKPLEVTWLCYPCHMRWDHFDPKLSNRDRVLASIRASGGRP